MVGVDKPAYHVGKHEEIKRIDSMRMILSDDTTMLIALTCKKIIVKSVNRTRTASMATGTLITGAVSCCGSADCAFSMEGGSIKHSDLSVGKARAWVTGPAAGAHVQTRKCRDVSPMTWTSVSWAWKRMYGGGRRISATQ